MTRSDRPTRRPAPGEPGLARITYPAPLRGPGPDAFELGAAHGVEAACGGGLVALVDPTRGLRGLWTGNAHACGPLLLRIGDRILPPSPGTRLDGAGWERRIPLPGTGESPSRADLRGEAPRSGTPREGGQRPAERWLLERGVVLDSAPALLVQWTLAWEEEPRGGPAARSPLLHLELRPAGGGRPITVALEPGADGAPDGAGIAITPPGSDPTRLAPRLHPPAARERTRRELRGGPPEEELVVEGGRTGGAAGPTAPGGPRQPVGAGARGVPAAALMLLDRCALSADPPEAPAGPFLLGVEEGEPRFARGTALAEIGLGALQAGRRALAWGILEALLHGEEAPPPLAVVHLAAAFASWTGQPARLLPHRAALDTAAARIRAPSGAGFPGPSRAIRGLAQAVEPLGRGWREALLAMAGTLGGGGPQRRLPVIGAGAPPAPPPAPAPDAPAYLPHPEAFAPLDGPGLTPQRTLHAARLVRAWVEGALGAAPDAAYGRLHLSPDLTAAAWPGRVRGLRVGDARIGLDCRIEGGACRLRLLQEGGRVPSTVVLRLRLPLEAPVSVRMGGEEADVSVEPIPGGVAIECQFPLDPQRRIIIAGEA